MNIDFVEPVYPIDCFAPMAFIEILNLILLSENIVELNRHLLQRNFGFSYRKLSGYFRWTYGNECFTLWQRTCFDAESCFRQEVLAFKFADMVRADRRREHSVIN